MPMMIVSTTKTRMTSMLSTLLNLPSSLLSSAFASYLTSDVDSSSPPKKSAMISFFGMNSPRAKYLSFWMKSDAFMGNLMPQSGKKMTN